MQAKEHFYVSATGTVFSIYKLGMTWYLASKPSLLVEPFMSSGQFNKLDKYVRVELGFTKLGT